MKDDQEKDPNHVTLEVDNVFQPLNVAFYQSDNKPQEGNENE